MSRTTVVAAAVVLFPIVFAWFASNPMLYPWGKRCGYNQFCPPTSAQLRQWMNYANDPKTDFGLDYEDVEFASGQGFYLRGWFVPAVQPDSPYATVICHGGGSDRRSMLRHIPIVHQLGHHVLLFDMSDMGTSDSHNRGLGFGAREHKDVLAAIRFVLKKKPSVEKVLLYGTSMGATSALIAASVAANDSSYPIAAVVAENPFSAVEDLLSHAIDQVIKGGSLEDKDAKSFGLFARIIASYPNIVPLWLRKLAIRFAVWRANARGYDAILHVSNISVPVLYVHSDNDSMIPIDHSRELYKATRSGHTELWEVTLARHSEILNVYGDLYRQRVSSFVRKFMPDRPIAKSEISIAATSSSSSNSSSSSAAATETA